MQSWVPTLPEQDSKVADVHWASPVSFKATVGKPYHISKTCDAQEQKATPPAKVLQRSFLSTTAG